MVVQQLSFWLDQTVTDHSSKSMKEREREREIEWEGWNEWTDGRTDGRSE